MIAPVPCKCRAKRVSHEGQAQGPYLSASSTPCPYKILDACIPRFGWQNSSGSRTDRASCFRVMKLETWNAVVLSGVLLHHSAGTKFRCRPPVPVPVPVITIPAQSRGPGWSFQMRKVQKRKTRRRSLLKSFPKQGVKATII